MVEQPVQAKKGNKDKNSTDAQQPSSTVTLYLVQIFCSWWLKYLFLPPPPRVKRKVSKELPRLLNMIFQIMIPSSFNAAAEIF